MAPKRRPSRLSASFVKTVTQPRKYGDGRGGHGLALVVKARANGGVAKSWTQRVSIRGGPERNLGLGTYPEVSLADARAIARNNSRLARAGIDPREKDKRASLFAEAAEFVFGRDCAKWGVGHQRNVRRFLDNHILPALGTRRVDAIEMKDIAGLMEPIWMSIPNTARKVLAYTGRILDHCVLEGDIESNPVNEAIRRGLGSNGYEVEHFPSVPHHLVGQAMSRVRQTNRADIATKLCLRAVMLTACRQGEVRKMTWDEIRWKDIESRADWNDHTWDEVDWDKLEDGSVKTIVWWIPAEHTKMDKAHRIPVSTALLSVLREARELRDTRASDHVFPSPYPPHGAIQKSTPQYLCRRLKLGGTPHGFRSSFRDWCAESNVPFEVAELALAHELPPVVRAYVRTDLLEARAELMERWAEYLQGTLSDGWKWTAGSEEDSRQLEILSKQLGTLTEQLSDYAKQNASLVDLLIAAEKRAAAAEIRMAEMEDELGRLRVA